MEPNRRADCDHVSTWQLICILKCLGLVSSFASVMVIYFASAGYITVLFLPYFQCILVFVHKLEKTRMERCTPFLNMKTSQTCVYLQFCNLHFPLMLLIQLIVCRKMLLMQSLLEEQICLCRTNHTIVTTLMSIGWVWGGMPG